MAKIDVFLGSNQIVASPLKYTTSTFTKHPNWASNGIANNIGLIKLPEIVTFTGKKIKKIDFF